MIFVFQRILPHYRLPIFEKLNSELNNELVVISGQKPKDTHHFDVIGQKMPFKSVYIENRWFLGEKAVWQNFTKVFRRYGTPQAVISEHSPRILSSYPLLVYCKILKIPIILWGHGGSRKRNVVTSNKWQDKIHRWLVKNCDAYICYTDGIKENLSEVTKSNKLFVARNTLDTDALFVIKEQLTNVGKQTIKEELQLKKKYYLCFIGRLVAEKQMDYALDVYGIIKQSRQDVGFIIVGDGPERNALENQVSEKKLTDIIFTGKILGWGKSGKFLFCSDVLINPGEVGLSVNHAFCFGLPVVTQKKGETGPYHGPEIEYVVNGQTGFLCDNSDKKQMAQKIIDIFKNDLRFDHSVSTYCKQNLSPRIMIDGIKEAVFFVTKNDGVNLK